MMTVQNALTVTDLDPAEAEDWLNASALHLSHNPDGAVLVCLKSLLASVKVPRLS